MNVISQKVMEFVTLAEVTDGNDSVILEFKNELTYGLHPFVVSSITKEEYDALNPNENRDSAMKDILSENKEAFNSLFSTYQN